MKNLLVLSFFLFLFSISYSQNTRLIEKVVKKENELTIPYEKYQLANGLILIIHEDHSDPLIRVELVYHVGSSREELGKSGFAHLFEHMLFQGSEHVADEEHFKIVTESGGTTNGSTNFDRTNYYEIVPSNQLETMLWLESDRMGFFLNALDQQKFEIQRATVKNERGQRSDNVPYGTLFENAIINLFPYGSPYAHSTIGFMSDLDRANVEDVKKFFSEWYNPNNATLVIAGDVKPKEVVALVEKYFGTIQKGPTMPSLDLQSVSLTQDRYVSYEDSYIVQPALTIIFPTVPLYHPDEPALECLASILGSENDPSTILYKKFIQTQKANQSHCFQLSFEKTGFFLFSLIPVFPKQGLPQMEEIFHASLQEFEKRGVTDDDMIQFKSQIEAYLISSLQSVSGKVKYLSEYQIYTGNPNQLKDLLKKYLAVTKEDVMRVYTTYFKNKKALYLSTCLKGKKTEQAAKPDNYSVIKTENQSLSSSQTLSYKRPVDNFDRSKKPISGNTPVVPVPDYWTSTLANGLKMIGVENREVPSIQFQIAIKGGHRLLKKEKAGLSILTARMMEEATQDHTAEEIAIQLKRLGSEISFSCNAEETTITVWTLKKNIDATIKILEEQLYRPKFDEKDFERLRDKQIEDIKRANTSPVTIASNVFNSCLYGTDYIMGIPLLGTEQTVANLTLQDVKNYYQSNYGPSITKVVVVGDISKKEFISKLTFLNKWKPITTVIPIDVQKPLSTQTTIYLVNKEKAAQSQLRIGYIALPYDATGDFYKSTLMNFVLGGDFNSRINLLLREKRGFTYNAKSAFSGSIYSGPFVVAAGVRANATDTAIVDILSEIKLYRENGIKDQELAFLRKAIGQEEALKYETPNQKAAFIKRILEYGLDKDFTHKQNEIIQTITKKEMDELAKKYLPLEHLYIIVVGDKNLIKPGLEKLGYPIIEVDEYGNKK